MIKEFASLLTGETHSVNLFGLVTVNFKLRWLEESSGSIIIDNIVPSDNVKSFYNNDGYWETDFSEYIMNHLDNHPLIRAFNAKITEFIEKANCFGEVNYKDVDWFYRKNIWPS